jgi:hypothetical protein
MGRSQVVTVSSKDSLDESGIEAIMRAVERRRHSRKFSAPSAFGGEFRQFLLGPPDAKERIMALQSSFCIKGRCKQIYA